MCASTEGYVNYFEILDLPLDAKPGEVRRVYRRRMKGLVSEIARVEITQERRAHYLLEMAKYNAALFLLRDAEPRQAYWDEREALIALEKRWREAAAAPGTTGADGRTPVGGSANADALRRAYDGRVRSFLSKYVEELMLEAGRDKECVEASHWDAAHERHAFRILRHYRHSLYQQILQRLPYADVTPPQVDWDERRRTVAAIVAGGSA